MSEKIYSLKELKKIYHRPFFQLIQQAREVFLEHWKKDEVQLCRLLSIKSNGCSEDCGYCAQSGRYTKKVKAGKLMTTEEILPLARKAKEDGATRFCMGAAWRGIDEKDKKFDSIVKTIREVAKLGIEVCVTLGHLSEASAGRLKEAGLTSYNHNIDTSPEYYPKVVTTHTFDDRLKTIRAVQKAGIALCCGGILGMGESTEDRLKMLEVLVNMNPQPESVPINSLIPIPSTPMENQQPPDVFELVRMIATMRIALPKSRVRLAAGRSELSSEGQALCFFAGANSIFFGDKLLTVENTSEQEDLALLKKIDLSPLPL